MNLAYIICGIITLVLYIICELQEWREGHNVNITRGDALVIAVMVLCGYFGLAVAIAIIAEHNFEWLEKDFLTYKHKADEEVEGDDQKGE